MTANMSTRHGLHSHVKHPPCGGVEVPRLSTRTLEVCTGNIELVEADLTMHIKEASIVASTASLHILPTLWSLHLALLAQSLPPL